LTVMNQPTEMFGALAAQLLLDRITNDDKSPKRSIVLPTDLIVRESCGAKAGWSGVRAARKLNQPTGNR
jgi:DNA-binding LacI/PurR family transcriptional regulator